LWCGVCGTARSSRFLKGNPSSWAWEIYIGMESMYIPTGDDYSDIDYDFSDGTTITSGKHCSGVGADGGFIGEPCLL
jgi:hypothetical protein